MSIEIIFSCFQLFNDKCILNKDSIIADNGRNVFKIFFRDMIKIECDDIYLKSHIDRVVQKNIKSLNFEDEENMYFSVQMLDDILRNPYDYCTISGEKLKVRLDIISYNKEYFDDYCKVPTDNIVCEMYTRDKTAFSFIISTGMLVLAHKKLDLVMVPKPKYFSDIQKFDKKDFEEIIKNLKISYSDKQLFDTLKNKNNYYFLKFLLKTNIVNFHATFDNEIDKEIDYDFISGSNITKPIMFNVTNIPQKEELFNNQTIDFLFHGSGFSNMYGVLRNGVKNCSGTAMMVHGQVHGPGVYLTDSLATAGRYSLTGSPNNLQTILVLQILGNASEYKKVNGIFVVPDDKKILLKHIVVAKSISDKNVTEITNQFSITRKIEIIRSNEMFVSIYAKRMATEIKYYKKCGFKILSQDNNIFVLEKDDVEITVEYPSSYPTNPPFIWISKGKPIGKFITDAGVIVFNDIMPKKWNTKIILAKYLDKIMGSLDDKTDKTSKNDRDLAVSSYEECVRTFT